MPNRILREGILTSHRVDRLSEGAELFYRRLMSRLDDYGRCEAHAELLRTACFPLRVDRVRAKHINSWLSECEKSALIVVYESGGKRYIQALDWKQQVRSPSKCPAPDEQMIRKCIADAHLDVVVGVVEGVGEDSVERKALSAPEAVNGDAVCWIPLNDGTEFGVSKLFAEELAKLYPQVDVPQTLNEIRGWNVTHPKKRKTRSGVVGHINTWMAKEQNRGA